MPITGRPKKVLVLTADERQALMRLTKRARVNRWLAFRARLVLACADDTLNNPHRRCGSGAASAVARRSRTTNATVGKWRQRFVERRLEGIYDARSTITDTAQCERNGRNGGRVRTNTTSVSVSGRPRVRYVTSASPSS